MPTPRSLIPAVTLLWGLQASFLAPALALLLASLYGASPGQLGIVLTVYNVATLVASFALPAWADRSGVYLQMMVVAGAFTAALALSLSLVTSLTGATLALVLLGGPASVGFTMLFAHLRHIGATTDRMMQVRALFAFAWVAGPPVAAVILDQWGGRALLGILAVVASVNVATAWRLTAQRRQQSPASPDPVAPRTPTTGALKGRVIAVTVAFVMLQATNTSSVAAISLFVTQRMGVSVSWAGAALGVAAAIEIPTMLLMGRLSRRFSNLSLVATGSLAGVAYYTSMVFLDSVLVLLAVQVLNAWFVSAVQGIGITVFQDLVRRPGLASGLFSNTNRIGAILTGPIIALAGTTPLGYGTVFAVNAGLAMTAGTMLAVLWRRTLGHSRVKLSPCPEFDAPAS